MPAAASPETVVVRLRPAARALVLPTAALLADIAAVSYFAGSLPETWMTWALLGAGALVLLLLFLLPLTRWLSQNYTITTRRIIIRSGLLVRSRQELLHSRGYDVTVRRSGLQLLFRSGDVLINTGLEHPVLLRDVPRADLVQSALHELMEAAVNPIGARRQWEQSHRPPSDETGETGEPSAGWAP